ncbi:MAG: AAA family ATPase [Myxococcota bacterium]
MGPVEALRGHLRAALRERQQAAKKQLPLGELPFITISRQAGAGGRSLASAILAEFEKHPEEPRLQGWHSFDDELCQLIVSDPELNVSFNELITESFRTRSEDLVSVMLGKSFQDDVQQRISVTLRNLALAGKAILIGRNGVAITRDLAPGIHIRLIAARESRVRHMMGGFEISEEKAGRWVDDQDRARAKMMKSRFRQDIEDPLRYDATWNTDYVPLEAIARWAVDMVLGK